MGKTIITHLLEGTPKGIQSIQVSNKNIMAFVMPRADLKKIKGLEELKTPSLYILFGEDETTKQKAYIGETDNFIDRVTDHNKKKDFWNTAIVFISQANTINKADILYLEYLSINSGLKTNHFDLAENKQIPKRPNLQRHVLDTMEDFFEDVKFITEFVGYSIFKTIEISKSSKNIFHTTYRGSKASGFYDENGFTVLKGSVISKDTVPSFGWNEKRERFIKESVKLVNDELTLITDFTFSSPSTAIDFCVGSSNNGWLKWKNKDGKTLDEVYRK